MASKSMFSSWSPTAALVDGVKMGSASFSAWRRREDRVLELGGLLQPLGERDAADGAGGLVVLPAAADQIAAGDGFHRHGFEFLRHHRAPGVQRRIHAGRQHRGDIDAGQVVGHQVSGLGEPEVGDLAKHLALAGNGVGQHHVERGQAVGGHHQQAVAIGRIGGQAIAGQVEHVADLAAVAQGEAGQIGLEQRRGHKHSLGSSGNQRGVQRRGGVRQAVRPCPGVAHHPLLRGQVPDRAA
jgi:hypothetical protein